MRLVSQSSVTPPALFGGRITGRNPSGPITRLSSHSHPDNYFFITQPFKINKGFFFSFLDWINGENNIFRTVFLKYFSYRFFFLGDGLMVNIF